jgi:hypothetical protein
MHLMLVQRRCEQLEMAATLERQNTTVLPFGLSLCVEHAECA